MRAKCSVFIATRLDGFIARSDGRIDWLDEAETRVPAGEDCGHGQFMSTVDALVMGRHTFELACSFARWPWGTTPIVVLSSTLSPLPAGLPDSVSLACAALPEVVAQLSASRVRHIYVDGSVTIQRFLAADLVDELTITTIAVLLGAGQSLLGPLAADIRLEHVSTRAFDFGCVQSQYRIARQP